MTRSDMSGNYFDEIGGAQGRSIPGFDTPSKAIVFEVPGGSSVVIELISIGARRATMPVQGTATEMEQLSNIVGTVPTLNWSGGATDVFFESMDAPVEVKPGHNVYQSVLHLIKQ